MARASGAGVTAAELQELVADVLTQAHVPREVRFVSELPMTHADKVDKRPCVSDITTISHR